VPLPVRTLFIAVSADGIDDVSTKLADILRAAATPALALTFTSRRDLGHGTIFRALAPAALAAALR
jgi:hypothetical protein